MSKKLENFDCTNSLQEINKNAKKQPSHISLGLCYISLANSSRRLTARLTLGGESPTYSDNYQSATLNERTLAFRRPGFVHEKQSNIHAEFNTSASFSILTINNIINYLKSAFHVT